MSSTESGRRKAAIVLCALVVALAGCGGAESRKARHIQKGEQYLAAGNLEKARVEFRNALQIAPTDSRARYENGVVDAKLGNLREAAQFYQAAIDSDPENIAARAALGRLFLFAGTPERALDTIRPSIAKHPDDPTLLTVRASARYALKDPSGALADAERAVGLTGSSDAVAVLAGIYQSQNQADKARELVEGALKKAPDSVDLRLILVQIYSSLGMQAQAESLLVDLVRLKPNDKGHRIRLAQFYVREKRPDDGERVLRDARKAFPNDRDVRVALIGFLNTQRSREAATKELAAMMAASPGDYDLQFDQAQFEEQGQEVAQAEASYRRIIAEAGTTVPGITARTRLAALEVRQNDLDDARKLVDEVLASAPRDNNALILRGNIALAQKDPASAIADLRAVLRDQPNAIGVMRSLARAHVANGEPVLAEEILRRALEANPNDTTLELDLAQIMAENGRSTQAKPLIDELAKDQPSNVHVLETQYKIAMATGDLVTARAAADALVATDPKSGAGYYYQGVVAEAGHRTEDALKLFSTAVDIQPDSADALEGWARAMAQLKRTPEALKRLDDVIARYPQSPAPYTIKGDLLLAAQRPADAAVAFRSEIERDPKSPIGYGRLASAQIALHDQPGAIATLTQGIDQARSPEPLQVSLAALYDSMRRPQDAEGVYEAALRRDPHADFAANNLAMLLVTYQRDQASLDRAAQLTSRFAESANPDFLDTYGWVLYKRGDAAAALVALRGVLAKAPDSPIALYHLGMAQVLAGQVDAARDNLSRALNAGKPFPGMEEAKAALEKLVVQAPTTAAVPKS
jgi:tetratricopeptide (TPR) repeat protein